MSDDLDEEAAPPAKGGKPAAKAPGEGEAEGEEAKSALAKAGKKKLILLGGGALLLVIIIAAVVFFLLSGGKDTGKATIEVPGPPVRHEFPSITADLKTGKCCGSFLRLQIVVEISGAQNLATMQKMEAEIVDAIRLHLRDKEREELVGRENAERLRQELVAIINAKMAPEKVMIVLFKEIFLQ